MTGTGHKLTRLSLVALVASLTTGCIDYLDEGEIGRARYFGEVRGSAPLNLIPPVSDREGNVYVLYGDRDINETEAFIGHARGGWSTGCEIHKGDDRGSHGWVGRATDRAWYWSGDALVEVNGTSGNCLPILDTDPASGANLMFQAIIPMVMESPSRSTVLAMVQTSSDAVPFHVVVDLDIGRYSDVRQFEPASATDVIVLGTGADRDSRTGFVVVRYNLDGESVVEGLFFDDGGNIISRTPITGASAAREDAIVGHLQSTDGHVVIGLFETGEMIRFDRNRGETIAVPSMTPVGVHKHIGRLYLVGTDNGPGEPVVAALSEIGEVGTPERWLASIAASGSMDTMLTVLDERSEPRQVIGWQAPSSAIGSAPFLSPYSPDVYAEGTTGWLLAGPSFQQESNPQTAVAFAPIGISYP